MNLGPHAVFIILAYAVAIVVIGAIIAWVMADYAMQRRTLGELEARGITRRSEREAVPVRETQP